MDSRKGSRIHGLVAGAGEGTGSESWGGVQEDVSNPHPQNRRQQEGPISASLATSLEKSPNQSFFAGWVPPN